METTAQILSIAGMIFNLISFQQKTHKRAVFCQLFAALIFSISFFMLGAYVGGILNAVGTVRNFVFMLKEKTRADSVVWLVIFICAFSISYPMTFLVFDTEPILKNFIIELLPVVAMIIATVSFRLGSAKAIRRLGLFSSPMWLIYNIFCFSIGAIASEILNLISMIVGIIRLDIKKKNTKAENTEETNGIS